MAEPGAHLADVIGRARVLLIEFDGEIWSPSAGPATGLADLVRTAKRHGWRIAVVSNVDSDLIYAHVRADKDLRTCLDGQAAGVSSLERDLLMPSPHLIRAGLTAATRRPGQPPPEAVLVGATEWGIQAARAAGVSAIGYAREPATRGRLAGAGADAISETLDELADAIAHAPH